MGRVPSVLGPLWRHLSPSGQAPWPWVSPRSPVVPVAPRDEAGGTSPQLTPAEDHLVSLVRCFMTEEQGFARGPMGTSLSPGGSVCAGGECYASICSSSVCSC